MFRSPIKEINAEYPAEEKYLDSIARVTREACAAAGMSRKQTSAMLLAVEEGTTNIIRHAYLYEKGFVRFRVVIYKKLIVLSLFDTGRSFQPKGSAKLSLERLVETGRRGGLGFYMIQKIMDSVEYISSSGTNELRMFKRLDKVSASTPPLLRRMFSLRVRFSLWTFAVVSAIVFVAQFYTYDRTSHQLRKNLDDTVLALTMTIAGQAAGDIINQHSAVEFDELIVSYTRANPTLKQIVLIDSVGLIIAHSEDIRLIQSLFQPPPEIEMNLEGHVQPIVNGGEPENTLVYPITTGQRRLGTVLVKYSSASLEKELKQARVQTTLLTGLLLLIGVVGIYLLSNYFVTPIVKITQRVRRFSRGDLESELPLEGAEEFFEISRALNDMTTRLSRDRKIAIEQERMAKEIEVASQIQKTLLPKELPDLAELELEAFYRAAQQVGGDLYDVVDIGEGRYCLVVADVSGKGVPASLVMSVLRTVIRIYAEGADSARDTLIKVNDHLVGNIPSGLFVTVMLAVYDSKSRSMKLVSAGHNPLLYFHAIDQSITQINPKGMPLGLSCTLKEDFADRLEEITLSLSAGDSFFMYTDGVTESTNRDGEQFGIERTIKFLSDVFGVELRPELSTISSDLVQRIDSFTGSGKQHDDITFLLARSIFSEQEGDSKSAEKNSVRSQSID